MSNIIDEALRDGTAAINMETEGVLTTAEFAAGVAAFLRRLELQARRDGVDTAAYDHQELAASVQRAAQGKPAK
jgi:hypothetical protein